MVEEENKQFVGSNSISWLCPFRKSSTNPFETPEGDDINEEGDIDEDSLPYLFPLLQLNIYCLLFKFGRLPESGCIEIEYYFNLFLKKNNLRFSI